MLVLLAAGTACGETSPPADRAPGSRAPAGKVPPDAAPPGSVPPDGGDVGDRYPGVGHFGRIWYSDLTYLGAFKCPDSKTFSFAKGPIAYVPTRNTLLAVGKAFQELEIPEPVISKDRQPSELHEAKPVAKMFDPMRPMAPLLGKARSLGGVTWFEGRFWVATWEFYNAAARDNLGITSFDEDFGDPRGAWRVGPPGVNQPIKDVFHANKTHDYIMVIPENWSSTYTPGLRLAGGRHREAGSNGGGRGPALYAFAANADAPPGADLDGVPLMYFMEHGKIWPEYRRADRYHAIWISRGNRQAVIVGSMKGTGPDTYGLGVGCDANKGFHAPPYEPRMYFIDVNDLGEVARGEKKPWSVRPYEQIVPEEMWGHDEGDDASCKRDWMEGWAFDEERGLLYASQPKAYEVGRGQNRMIVHVWQVH